jgi:hypothetical protein
VPADHAGDDALWAEWLSMYLEHCRRKLTAAQLAELVDALPRVVTGGVRLETIVSERTAAEGRWLVDFLARVEDQRLRAALLAEAVARLT